MRANAMHDMSELMPICCQGQNAHLPVVTASLLLLPQKRHLMLLQGCCSRVAAGSSRGRLHLNSAAGFIGCVNTSASTIGRLV